MRAPPLERFAKVTFSWGRSSGKRQVTLELGGTAYVHPFKKVPVNGR